MWNVALLGDVCQISSSKRIFAKEYQKKGIPFYRGKEIIEKHKGNDVTTELFISPDRYKEIKNKYEVPRKGDVLLTSVGTLGVTWLVDEDEFYFKDGNITWLRPNEKIIPEFLYLWLNSTEAQNQIDAKCIGSTQKALTIETLNKFYISLPSIDLQYKIIAIIKPLEDKIVNNRKINKNLEQQAETLFHSLFVENVNLTWKDGVLSDLGTVVAGGTPSKTKPEYYSEQGIAWITPKDLSLNKSKFISHGEIDISELGFSKSSATKMPTGTVLFSSRAPIGYIAIAVNEVTTNQGFKSVVPNENIGTAFMYYLLKFLLPTIEGMASGSTFKEISGAGMKSVPVVIPDNETIEKFNTFCTPIFQQQEVLETENSRLTDIRDALLPKLMSGELDVSDIDL